MSTLNFKRKGGIHVHVDLHVLLRFCLLFVSSGTHVMMSLCATVSFKSSVPSNLIPNAPISRGSPLKT